MTRRFRLLAGPNGSGKSTLKRRLERDYAVNFYDFLNADEIYAEVKATGFRTYLYFVATEVPEVNLGRVENRAQLRGHAVPPEKVVSRHALSIQQVPAALPHLSRAFFFDNSEATMRYLASWSPEEGLQCVDAVAQPSWFGRLRPALGAEAARLPRGTAFETSAEAASREAVNAAFAAELPITVFEDGRVVRVKEEAR